MKNDSPLTGMIVAEKRMWFGFESNLSMPIVISLEMFDPLALIESSCQRDASVVYEYGKAKGITLVLHLIIGC